MSFSVVIFPFCKVPHPNALIPKHPALPSTIPTRAASSSSLGAGVKCLPASHLSVHGDVLHDLHMEVIVWRGAIWWLLEEVQCDAQAQGQSVWVCACDDGLYVLRDNMHLWMYALTIPCAYVHHFHSRPSSAPPTHHLSPSFFSHLGGDASMGILAATQDPEVSSCMDTILHPLLSPDTPS
jgi:Adenosine-deaminase (editase) domain